LQEGELISTLSHTIPYYCTAGVPLWMFLLVDSFTHWSNSRNKTYSHCYASTGW
jgi:hypothetical protein